MAPPRIDPIIRIFAQKKLSRRGCWLYQSPLDRDGYGVITVGRNKQFRVHRIVYERFIGNIPPDALVCHKCDVRNCFNPKHLFLGTPQDNASDRDSKGRHRSPIGEQHPLAKLTKSEVVAIREARISGARLEVLAAKYGVTFQHISAIARRKLWRHI